MEFSYQPFSRVAWVWGYPPAGARGLLLKTSPSPVASLVANPDSKV